MTDLHSTYYDPATPVGVVGRDEYIVEQDEMGDSALLMNCSARNKKTIRRKTGHD